MIEVLNQSLSLYAKIFDPDFGDYKSILIDRVDFKNCFDVHRFFNLFKELEEKEVSADLDTDYIYEYKIIPNDVNLLFEVLEAKGFKGCKHILENGFRYTDRGPKYYGKIKGIIEKYKSPETNTIPVLVYNARIKGKDNYVPYLPISRFINTSLNRLKKTEF